MKHDDARPIHDTGYDARLPATQSTDLLTRPRPEVPCQPGTTLITGREVLDHLVGLVGPRLSSSPVLWFTFLDGARQVVPLAIPFDGLPGLPSPGPVAEIVDVVSSVLAQHPDGLVVLVAISRPSGVGSEPSRSGGRGPCGRSPTTPAGRSTSWPRSGATAPCRSTGRAATYDERSVGTMTELTL